VAGGRYSHAEVAADDVSVPGSPFGPVHDSWSSVVGSIRLLAKAHADWRVYTGVSQSFRAPNLSDLTRFDVARSGEQEVPAPDLDPEEYLTFEVGVRHDSRDVGAELTWFYTDVEDQIRRFPTGNTVGGLPEVTKGNVGDGWFTGIEAAGRLGLGFLGAPAWEVRGSADWVGGRITSAVGAGQLEKQHPDVLPPPSGFLAVRWNDPRRDTWFELFTSMAYHQHRLTAADRADPQRIPPGGLPGYAVFGARGSTEVAEGLRASLAIENIADRDYRIMGSGLNEPGTNVIMTLEARF
jgi:hemoglobin/transferrin/lactoferrin receptor protein